MLNPRMCYAGILVRGLNAENKWESLKNKVTESQCDVVCLQETKKENFDILFIKLFCPCSFDSFCFIPSVGASGGILIIWKSSIFAGIEIFKNGYALLVEFTSCHDNSYWVLTNIYGPCDADGKRAFLEWFGNIQMPDDICWLVVGDFNLLRKPENKNRPGGNASQSFFLMKPLALLVWRKYLCMEESSHGQISSNHLCLRD